MPGDGFLPSSLCGTPRIDPWASPGNGAHRHRISTAPQSICAPYPASEGRTSRNRLGRGALPSRFCRPVPKRFRQIVASLIGTARLNGIGSVPVIFEAGQSEMDDHTRFCGSIGRERIFQGRCLVCCGIRRVFSLECNARFSATCRLGSSDRIPRLRVVHYRWSHS